MLGHPRVRCRELGTALSEAFYMSRLRRLEYRDSDAVRRYQMAKLRAALDFAGSSIPFYRDAWWDERDSDPYRRLARLPIVTKELVMTSRGSMLNPSMDPSRLWKNRSSGSSGTPGVYYSDWHAARIGKALERFTMFESGMRPWHRLARDYAVSPKPRRWYESFGFLRTHFFSSFEDQGEAVRRLASWSPHVLYVTPSILQLLCLAALKEGIRFRVGLVLSNGEILFDSQRQLFEDVLGAVVRDQYGSAEFQRIAWECEEGSYHVLPEQVVEILDDDLEEVSPGERGRVVCTDLNNRAMPLIRYDTGDLAVRGSDEECPCGRKLATLTRIEGKDDSFIVDGDGGLISPRILSGSLGSSPEILIFEATQREKGHLLLSLVLKDHGLDPASIAGVKALRERLGGRLVVETRVVDDLPLHGSGKRRTVFSHLAGSKVSPDQA